MEFEYTPNDLCVQLLEKEDKNGSHPRSKPASTPRPNNMTSSKLQKNVSITSKTPYENQTGDFDETLQSKWDLAQTSGLFRYKFNENMPCKVVSEKYQFIAQVIHT